MRLVMTGLCKPGGTLAHIGRIRLLAVSCAAGISAHMAFNHALF